MKKNNLLLVLTMAVFILPFFSSCEKLGLKKGDPYLMTHIKYVGYEYVLVEIIATDFEDIYSDGEFYVGTTPEVDVSSSYPKEYQMNGLRFYPIAVNLNPDISYYGVASLQGVKGQVIELKSKKAVFSCQVSNYTITGDLLANQSGSFGSYNYLRDSDSYLGGPLGGDLKKINLKLAYGNWDPGVYTTYVDGEKFVHNPMSKNPEVTVEGFDGTIYTAKPGQVLWLKDGGSNDWHLVFCDMVFADNQGNEVTLSSNLATRIF